MISTLKFSKLTKPKTRELLTSCTSALWLVPLSTVRSGQGDYYSAQDDLFIYIIRLLKFEKHTEGEAFIINRHGSSLMSIRKFSHESYEETLHELIFIVHSELINILESRIEEIREAISLPFHGIE